MSTSNPLITLLDLLDERRDATALRRRSYEELRAGPGDTVVDVGCGAGRAVAELTELGVRAVGVDVDATMLATARQRYPSCDVTSAGAEHLPFGDGTLAGYRADKVLHNIADPGLAVAEARRVLRPGGRVVLLDQDWDAIAVDAADPELTRTIVRTRADGVASPRVARAYRSLLLDAGFGDVAVDLAGGVLTDPALVLPMLTGYVSYAVEHGALTKAEADGWLDDQRARADTDRMFVAVPLFLACATRG